MFLLENWKIPVGEKIFNRKQTSQNKVNRKFNLALIRKKYEMIREEEASIKEYFHIIRGF